MSKRSPKQSKSRETLKEIKLSKQLDNTLKLALEMKNQESKSQEIKIISGSQSHFSKNTSRAQSSQIGPSQLRPKYYEPILPRRAFLQKKKLADGDTNQGKNFSNSIEYFCQKNQPPALEQNVFESYIQKSLQPKKTRTSHK